MHYERDEREMPPPSYEFPWKQFSGSVAIDQREVFYTAGLRLLEEEVADLDEAGFRALLRGKLQEMGDSAMQAWRERD